MVEVKSYVPYELSESIVKRSEELEISKSEYMRLLAHLDVSIQSYQTLINYAKILYQRISDIQDKLGIYMAPVQEAEIK